MVLIEAMHLICLIEVEEIVINYVHIIYYMNDPRSLWPLRSYVLK